MTRQTEKAVDWQKVIADIVDRGFSYAQIADECGMSKGQVFNLMAGRTRSLLYEAGDRLLQMYQRTKRMRRKRAH